MSERKVYGSRSVKERGILKRAETLKIQTFQDKHPLARMYRTYQYMCWAREDGNWDKAFWNGHFFLSGYANLSQELQAQFDDALPGRPPTHGSYSDGAWAMYLGSLIRSKGDRERLGDRLRQSIVDGWGEEYLPPVYRSLSAFVTEEPGF